MKKFNSWEEAEEMFYAEEGCMSDDVDREEARLMRWMEDNGHQVLEDDPYLSVARENNLALH